MITTQEIILRLIIAALCAGLVGIERERKVWVAGMRTHMLVGLGAALFMLVSMHGFSDVIYHPDVELDPSRVAAQVVSGIGFLGAGTIFFLRKGIVRGLTTASGLWTVAGIGLAIGGGMYVAGTVTTIIAIAVLWLLQPVEDRFFPRAQKITIRAILQGRTEAGELMTELLSAKGAETLNMNLEQDNGEWTLVVKSHGKRQFTEVTRVLNKGNRVKELNVEQWRPGS